MRRDQHCTKVGSFTAALAALVCAGLALAPAPASAQTGVRKSLTLFWDVSAGDNYTTTVGSASGYERIRVEGHIFANVHPGTVPLKLYYHSGRDDYALVGTPQGLADAVASGYVFIRTEGYAFPQPFPGTVPLKLYWNAARGDNATVAESRSEQDQKNSGYSYVRTEAYIFPASDPDFGAKILPLTYRRGSSAIAIAPTKTAFIVHEDTAGNGCPYSWIGTLGAHPHDVVLTVCNEGVVGIAVKDGTPYEVNPFRTDRESVFDYRVPPTQPSKTGTLIDLAIVYSPAVLNEYGAMAMGYNLSTKPAVFLKAYMQLAVDHANAILGASGVPTTLRLARTHYMSSLVESAFNSTDHALDSIANRGYEPCSESDRYSVKAFRDKTGADLVSIWLANRPTGFASGVAWIPPSTWYCDDLLAYSVVWGADVTLKNYTFVHELGHNLGVIHGHGEPTDFVDWDILQTTNYMYGHVDAKNGFRDVMAYGDACQPDSTACPKLPYFSTPKVLINPTTKAWSTTGAPMGSSSSADAARRIRERSGAVAGFRSLKCPGSAAPCGGSGTGDPPVPPPTDPDDPPIVVK